MMAREKKAVPGACLLCDEKINKTATISSNSPAREKPERGLARVLSMRCLAPVYFLAITARRRLLRLPPLLPTFSLGPTCLSV